jgi:pantothenate kinase
MHLGTTSDGSLDSLTDRAIGLATPGGRIIIGIAGSPGAGKTTLAKQLVERINGRPGAPRAVYLPMDGFHLANATLDRLGIHDRKGAIETFDGWGFVALLGRVLAERDHPVYAPSFERTVDEGIAGEIAISDDAEIVIAEGNYLLVDREPWNRIPALLAESWFCATDAGERLDRLVDRHTRHGRSPEAALEWASSVDGANALLIEPTRARADLVVSGSTPL